MEFTQFTVCARRIWLGLFAVCSVIVPAAAAEPSAVPIPANATLPERPSLAQPRLSGDSLAVRSQDLELVQSAEGPGAFIVRVGGQPFAVGETRGVIAYMVGTNGTTDQLRWVEVASAASKKFNPRKEGGALHLACEFDDPDGAHWQLEQAIYPGPKPGTLDIQVEIGPDKDREVAYLSMLLLFPGAGTFGESKSQALLAGLEYLENEPGSSEADVVGPAAKRQVPDNLKLTFPLMVVQNQDRYLALTWQMRPHFSAVFDSPDRMFNSGAHVMGLLFPGSDGKNRTEGSLLPHRTETVRANQKVLLRATLMGGLGRNVAPAISQYISLRGLPPLPAANLTVADYTSLAAAGWLDSKIREGSLIHHAIAGGNFPAGQAADAAVWMDWLALQTPPQDLAVRLTKTAKEVLAAVPPENIDAAGVGHVHYPLPSLVYGHIAENAARAEARGRSLLSRFEPNGSIRYHQNAGGPDYSKTHYSNEANGLTSRTVLDLLEAAALSGNRELLDAGIKRLHAMDKFNGGVPRGAQTWECPLHTPDILASAQMVRCYTLGYELTGDPKLLEQAQYWAWTGVPFVYLVNPTEHPVGLYSTIAVFGATQWRAPVWLGLPVQWCGLVYADALYRLVRHDADGPWKRIADGITLSGVQQSWPQTERDLQGLLPDSFVFRTQHRNGPAINPATVQACAARYFNGPPYDFRSFPGAGLRVHAPGEISSAEENNGAVGFGVQSWVKGPYYVLVNGLTRQPQLDLDGKKVECAAPHRFMEKEGWLVLRLEGKQTIRIRQ